jgi:hypothetical protein
MKPFHYAGIAEISGSVRSKKLSPVEVVAAHLKRIETVQPKLNAFVHQDAEAACAQARRAEDAVRRGGAIGPLLGVPITLKSCIDVAGWPCPAGSLSRKDYVAETDSTLASRLRAAGAILLGNTNTPEYLMAYETDNLVSGKTSNPWDLSHSAGGYCIGMFGGRRGQRRRRLDSRTSALLRHMRFEADPGKNSCHRALSRGRRSVFLDWRGRAHGTNDCRCARFV